MLLIKIENGLGSGRPITEKEFREMMPFSLPRLNPSVLEPYGWGIYVSSPSPKPGKYEKVVEVPAIKNLAGLWEQQWELVEMSEEEKAEADNVKAKQVRELRDSKLLETDWTQLNDSPINRTAWGNYRQQLRDITEQVGFPWDIEWPALPEVDTLQEAWDNFNASLITDPVYHQAVANVRASALPGLDTPVVVALGQVSTNGVASFALSFPPFCQYGQVTAEQRETWAQLAEAHHLPADFCSVIRGGSQ